MEKESKNDSREESRRRNNRSRSRDKERRDVSRDRKDRVRERERDRSRETKDRKRERSDSPPRRGRGSDKERIEDDRDKVKGKEREKEKDKDNEKSVREHENDKEKEKDKGRDKSRDGRDKEREKSREKGRDKSRDSRDRERDKTREKGRDKSREKETDKGRDKSRDGRDKELEKSREKGRDYKDARDKERGRSKDRSRERSDRNRRDRSEERRKDRSTDRREGKRERENTEKEKEKEKNNEKEKSNNDREKEKEDDREERETKRARRSNSRDRRRPNQRNRSPSRSKSRSISVAKDNKTLPEKQDSSFRRRRPFPEKPSEPNAKPVDENGQFVVGPKRDRWKPGQNNFSNDVSPRSDHQPRLPPSTRPPLPPLPPPKPVSNLPITPQIPHSDENPSVVLSPIKVEEDYYSTLMSRWHEELQHLYSHNQSTEDRDPATKTWALELENINILEKYAGKELYQKIIHFREQQSKQTPIQNEQPKDIVVTNPSIEDLLNRMESAESKDSDIEVPSTLVADVEPIIKEEDKEIEMEVEENHHEDIVESEEDGGFEMGDDFDLYGDLGGGLLATEEEDEEETKPVQQKFESQSSNRVNDEKTMNNMYGDLIDEGASKTELTTVSEERFKSKDNTDDFEEERKRSFQYFTQQHPSLPWTGLPYLTQDSSIQRMSLLSKSTRNQTFSSMFLKDISNIRQLFT